MSAHEATAAKDDEEKEEEEKEDERASMETLVDRWEQVNNGVMSDVLLKHHHKDDEHPVPAGSFKEKLLMVMSHWRFECFIVGLILIDLLVTLLEMGLEYRFICVSPELVAFGRHQIKGLHFDDEAAFTSHYVVQESSNASLPYSTLQKEAVKGAMMLQIGAGSIAKLVGGSAQPEEGSTAEGHAVEGQSEPEGEEGHAVEGHGSGHRHHEKTLLCEGPHGKRSHKLHRSCHVLGLSILSLFILELVLKAWINPSQFFRSKLQVLDLIVVLLSFTLDFVWPIFESRHPELLETKSDLVRVIVLFMRLIRVVKVMHATSEVLHKGLHYVKEMKAEIREKDEEIKKLKADLKAAQGKSFKLM